MAWVSSCAQTSITAWSKRGSPIWGMASNSRPAREEDGVTLRSWAPDTAASRRLGFRRRRAYLDSGRTIAFAKAHLAAKGAIEVRACAFIRKPAAGDAPIEHVGLDCPDRYLIGYGMDDAGRYRGLPYVGALAEGLYVSAGHGSRGLLSAPLGAEIIASAIAGEHTPVTADLLAAVNPLRFTK